MNDFHNRPLPSNRSFGLLFTVVFAGLAAWSLYRGAASAYVWGGLAVLTLALTLFAPDWLTPFNRAWMWIGAMMNRVVSPVVIGILYFCLIVPVGLAMRIAGRDPLRLALDPVAPTYWITRDPPGPSKDSFPHQF